MAVFHQCLCAFTWVCVRVHWCLVFICVCFSLIGGVTFDVSKMRYSVFKL